MSEIRGLGLDSISKDRGEFLLASMRRAPDWETFAKPLGRDDLRLLKGELGRELASIQLQLASRKATGEPVDEARRARTVRALRIVALKSRIVGARLRSLNVAFHAPLSPDEFGGTTRLLAAAYRIIEDCIPFSAPLADTENDLLNDIRDRLRSERALGSESMNSPPQAVGGCVDCPTFV